MSYAARIQDGIVVEVTHLPNGIKIEDAFHPDAGFVPATGKVQAGMLFREGKFLPEPPAPEPDADAAKAVLLAYAADARWRMETGGILVGKATVATDRASQAMIANAYQMSLAEPDEMVDFKAASGWIAMTSIEISALAMAVGRHVRRCFRIEREVCAAIEGGKMTALAEIDAVFAAG